MKQNIQLWWNHVFERILHKNILWMAVLALILAFSMVQFWQVQHSSVGGGIIMSGSNTDLVGGPMYQGAAATASAASSSVSAPQFGHAAAIPSPMAKFTALAAGTPSSSMRLRMVVEHASLTLAVGDLHTVSERLGRMAQQNGGYVESSQLSTSEQNPISTMQLRVPVVRFSTFLLAAEKLGKVMDTSQSGQDVTQAYQSGVSQLSELRMQEAAYTRLFAKARSMKDMITIQQALVQVQSEMSSLRSQQSALSREAQLATVNVTLLPTAFSNAAPGPIVTAWQQLVESLGQSTLAILSMIAWVFPWAILFVVIVFLARVMNRRGRR